MGNILPYMFLGIYTYIYIYIYMGDITIWLIFCWKLFWQTWAISIFNSKYIMFHSHVSLTTGVLFDGLSTKIPVWFGIGVFTIPENVWEYGGSFGCNYMRVLEFVMTSSRFYSTVFQGGIFCKRSLLIPTTNHCKLFTLPALLRRGASQNIFKDRSACLLAMHILLARVIYRCCGMSSKL